jgi:hypothetical protein
MNVVTVPNESSNNSQRDEGGDPTMKITIQGLRSR